MKHRRKKMHIKKRRFVLINRKKLTWLALAVFVVLQVFFTIQTATSGAELATLETEREQLLKENRMLAGRLVQSTSLTEIQENTGELEFSKPKNLFYVNLDEFVAKAPR